MVLEDVASFLRRRVVSRARAAESDTDSVVVSRIDPGTTISMLASEVEDVAGFACDSISLPALQVGTIVAVAGYLLWVEPVIALLAPFVYFSQIFLVPSIQKTINRLARRRTNLVRKLGKIAISETQMENDLEKKIYRKACSMINRIYTARMEIYKRKCFLTFVGNFLDALGPGVVSQRRDRNIIAQNVRPQFI